MLVLATLVLATRVAAELAGLAAAGFLGATADVPTPWRLLLAVGLPVILTVFWAAIAAPKAANPLPPRVRELLGTAALLLVAVGLGAADHPALAAAFAAAVVIDQALIIMLDPRQGVEARLAGGSL